MSVADIPNSLPGNRMGRVDYVADSNIEQPENSGGHFRRSIAGFLKVLYCSASASNRVIGKSRSHGNDHTLAERI